MRKNIIALTALLVIGAGVPVTGSQAQPGLSIQEELQRQQQIAENARMQVEHLRAELKLKEELIDLAVERNAALYGLASEIIEKGIPDSSIEPFLQLQRVEMENLKQDYEDRAYKARFLSSTLPPSVRKQMEAELQKKKSAKNEE